MSSGGAHFSVSRATRMLSSVSLGGPDRRVSGAVAGVAACREAVLDEPGTAETSGSWAEERMESELSALPPTSAGGARQDELKRRRDKLSSFLTPDGGKKQTAVYLPVVVSARPSEAPGVAGPCAGASGTVEVVSALAMVTSFALPASSPQ